VRFGIDGVNPFVALKTSHNAAGARLYTWDGEARLVNVEPAGTSIDGARKAGYVYDYLGRPQASRAGEIGMVSQIPPKRGEGSR
jgi:hypothetical protein